MRAKLMFIAMAMAVMGMLGFSGCKNACEKAFAKQADCMDSFCADNTDNAFCQARAESSDDAAADASGAACEGPAEEWAAGVLEKDCSDLLSEMGLVAAEEPAGDEPAGD